MPTGNQNLLSGAIEVEPEQSKREKNLARAIELSKYVLQRSLQDIQGVKPLITFQDVPFLYENSITLLSGGKGSYKSRISESAISCLFSLETTATGFKRTEDKFVVVYGDTERSISESLPLAIQRIRNQSVADKKLELPNFFPYTLIEFKRDERLDLLKDIIEMHRETATNKIILILDVVSDLVNDFNNAGESMTFLDYLNVLIAQYNISILLIIHENPGSTTNKQRGHLGTEAMNKSSVVVSLSNKSDIVQLKYLHIRESKNPGTFNLKYDDKLHCLIPISEDEAKIIGDTTTEQIIQLLPGILTNAVRSKTELQKELAVITGLSVSSIRNYLDKILSDNNISSLPFKLELTPSGNKKLYTIKEQTQINGF